MPAGFAQLGQSQISVTQDFYLGRKIASEDAARVLEIIGRPDAAALVINAKRRSDAVSRAANMGLNGS